MRPYQRCMLCAYWDVGAERGYSEPGREMSEAERKKLRMETNGGPWHCLRHAPTLPLMATWPMTGPHQGCGEFAMWDDRRV